MGRGRGRIGGLGAALALLLAMVVGALGAGAAVTPPSNDNRDKARELTLPALAIAGRTTGATREPAEPYGCGATNGGSVWYSFTSPGDRRIVVALKANGDLDAAVQIFERVRSQLTSIDCDTTDKNGQAELDFRPKKDGTYMVRVSQLDNSVAGTFSLDVAIASAEPTPPGPLLPRRGKAGTLDRRFNKSDAWSARLRAGRAYRVNAVAAGDQCLELSLFAPGVGSFDEEPIDRAQCSTYVVVTPEKSGRYSFLVTASSRAIGRQPYHLQIAPAGRDDLAPGIFIRNYARVKGRLDGSRVDVIDLYRFDVTRRSVLDLVLGTQAEGLEMLLRDDRGRYLGQGTDRISRRLAPGRYFVAVRADGAAAGRYTLRRISRTITSTRTRINGRRSAQIAPGGTATIGVSVSPGASGPVAIVVERFDPLFGWRFVRRYHPRAAGGFASATYRPPAVGRYRATAEFRGSRGFAPSEGGTATLLVAAPLKD